MIGKTLGHYEITSQLGKGGMGEVYQAKDRKLGRDVAIKVLPEEFAKDADRVARFQREAKLLASLNHPNIAAIHGLEDSDGTNFLVLELVEGETLADQLSRGAIPVEESLKLVLQIAEALEAAHEKGVIHRDLKPANIKVTPNGTIKVLDFGLAKVTETQVTNLSHSPTLSHLATQQGMILGTAGYMSPEQARGKPVDKRTDIWAFGCVVYEMLTGRAAFPGEDVTEILAAVVKEQPDLSKVPAQVRRLIQSCLEKDPTKRLRDVGDIHYLLDAPVPAAVSSIRTGRLGWAVAAALTLLAITAILGWLKTGSREGERAKTTLTIVPPSGATLPPIGSLNSAPQISPNGAFVMYEARDASGIGLFVRPLNSLFAQRAPGYERRTGSPFWSADSASVVYPANDQLIKVVMPDGSPQTIAKGLIASRGGTWSDRGTILISFLSGLSSIPASGGDPQSVDTSAIGSGKYVYPEFLPGGEDFLFLFAPGTVYDTAATDIYLATLSVTKLINPVLLLRNATGVRYTPAGGGRILFVRDDKLYSQRLDRKARKLEGEAELIVNGVGSRSGGGGDYSIARTGTIVWRPGRAALTQVTSFDRQGHQIGTTGPPGAINALRLSPDEKQLLAGKWLLDDNQQGRLALPAEVVWFGWSPNGLKLIGLHPPDQFVETSATAPLGFHALAGSNRANRSMIPQDISLDGKWLLELSIGSNSIVAESLQGPATGMNPLVVVQTGEILGTPRFSPDGRWIVYFARDPQSSATSSLYVQPFPDPGPRKQVASGGICPEWRRDGREILFLTSQSEIQSVTVESVGSNLRFGTPQKLFSGLRRMTTTTGSRPIAVLRDGSRIYITQPVEQPDSNMIHVMIGGLK